MYENEKSSNRSSLNRNPTGPNSSNHRCWAFGRTHRLALTAVALFRLGRIRGGRFLLPTNVTHQIAVFEFELEDFSAAGQTKPVPETSYLAQATDEAKQQLRTSGRSSLLDNRSHHLREGDAREALQRWAEREAVTNHGSSV